MYKCCEGRVAVRGARRTVVLVHVLGVRVLPVTEMVPLGGTDCEFQMLVFLQCLAYETAVARFELLFVPRK